jgi:hypothetical protein
MRRFVVPTSRAEAGTAARIVATVAGNGRRQRLHSTAAGDQRLFLDATFEAIRLRT